MMKNWQHPPFGACKPETGNVTDGRDAISDAEKGKLLKINAL
jgi:hypothetical protein